MLFLPLDYEDISETVNSAQILRCRMRQIVAGTGLGLSQTLAQRAEFYLQNFLTAVQALDGRIASTANAYILAFNAGTEDPASRPTRKLYQKLSRPVFVCPGADRIVATGSAGINLCNLSPDFALDFVRAFYRMRGGFEEVLYQIYAAGVPLPQQLR